MKDWVLIYETYKSSGLPLFDNMTYKKIVNGYPVLY